MDAADTLYRVFFYRVLPTHQEDVAGRLVVELGRAGHGQVGGVEGGHGQGRLDQVALRCVETDDEDVALVNIETCSITRPSTFPGVEGGGRTLEET